MSERSLSGEIALGMPVRAYVERGEHCDKFASHWSTIPDHRSPVRLFAEPDVSEALATRDATIERLREALERMHHAVCGPTGFAEAVRTDTNTAYPWPALDEADELARAALDADQ